MTTRAQRNDANRERDTGRYSLEVRKEYRCGCGMWLGGHTLSHGTIGAPCYRKRQAMDRTRFMLVVKGQVTGHTYSYSRIGESTARELIRAGLTQYTSLS